MKSINFKRNESVLRYNDDDGKKVKKKINWDRVVYFLILGAVLFLLLRWIVLNSIYMEANGQVIFENRHIQNVDDCRIIEYKVEEGEEVEKGDTLFIYMNDRDELDEGGSGESNGSSSLSVGDITINKIKSPDWIDKEIFSSKKSIALNYGQIGENKKLLSVLRSNIKRMEQEVILDVLPKSKLEDVYMRIESLQADIAQQQQENAFYAKYIAELEALKALQDSKPEDENNGINLNNSSNAGGDGNNDEKLKAFICPIDGVVSRIYKEEFEVALKSEIIMNVYKPENIKIKAYVNQEDIDNLDIGDEVTILFPDDTKSEGIVDKFHATTSILPDEFQKKYEPTTRSIIVDILPLTEKDGIKWQMYYKLGVVVRKSKY